MDLGCDTGIWNQGAADVSGDPLFSACWGGLGWGIQADHCPVNIKASPAVRFGTF